MPERPVRRGNGAGKGPGQGPARGGPARGYSWPPFEKGNTVSVRHGAYAVVSLGQRTEEIAEGLRSLVPAYAPSDEPAVRLLSLTFARLERAEAALERAKPDEATRLRQDALGWANAARRLLNDLGMTPTSRARLGLDLVRGEQTLSVMDYFRGEGAGAAPGCER